MFARKARADTAAAAVCWIVAKANDLFTTYPGSLRAKDLLAYFGLSGGVSQRAATLLKAGGFASQHGGRITLGSPDYLTSVRRSAMLEARDRHAATQ